MSLAPAGARGGPLLLASLFNVTLWYLFSAYGCR